MQLYGKKQKMTNASGLDLPLDRIRKLLNADSVGEIEYLYDHDREGDRRWHISIS